MNIYYILEVSQKKILQKIELYQYNIDVYKIYEDAKKKNKKNITNKEIDKMFICNKNKLEEWEI